MSPGNVILIFGVIATCFILSTNCDDSSEQKNKKEKTSIDTLVEKMKEFLTKLVELDASLQMPQSYERFDDEISHRYLWHWRIGQKIKNKENHFKRFKREYEKFVSISKECIYSFATQINNIFTYQQRYIGDPDSRATFLSYYNDKFSKEMVLKGNYNKELEKLCDGLFEQLVGLITTIYNMMGYYQPPPPAPVELVYYGVGNEKRSHENGSDKSDKSGKKKHKKKHSHGSKSSSSHSHSDEEKHGGEHGGGHELEAALIDAAGGAIVGATIVANHEESGQDVSDQSPVEEVSYSSSEQEYSV